MKRLLIIALIPCLLSGCGKIERWKANREKQAEKRTALVEAGITQRKKYFESTIPEEIRSQIPDDFYTYSGFRDWWRLPLVFPYQLGCVDSKDKALLNKHIVGFSVKNPNESSETLIWDINRIQTDNRMLVCEIQNPQGTSYGLFIYETGEKLSFDTGPDAWEVAVKSGYTGEQTFITIRELFSKYYGFTKEFSNQGMDPTR